jgi:hypothetical protein
MHSAIERLEKIKQGYEGIRSDRINSSTTSISVPN